MATKTKQVMLTVKPITYSALKRWALVEGLPMATSITVMLDRLAEPLSLAAAAREQAFKGHKGQAIELMTKLTGSSLEQLGKAMGGKKKSGSR